MNCEITHQGEHMKKVIYLHGFSSAGSTGTATMLRNYLYQDYGVSVLSPDIPVMPKEALAFLKNYIDHENPDLIIGTSMGAMYAELIKGRMRICVNPAFQMAKMLTFKHLGKNVDFQNKREDGAVSFKVDKQMVSEFKEIESTLSLKNVSPEEKKIVWGIFGKNDPVINCQKEFTKAYGKEHFLIIDGEHNLTQTILKRDIMPIIVRILELT